MVIGSFSDASISSTRPIMTAGPMERNTNPFNNGSEVGFGGGSGGGPPPRPCAKTMPDKLKHAIAAAGKTSHARLENDANIDFSRGSVRD